MSMGTAMAASVTTKRNGLKRAQSAAPQRSTKELALRASLALLMAVVGYYSVTFSMAQVLVKVDPARAHALAPYDGRITARLAAKMAEPDPKPNLIGSQHSDVFARQALGQDSTAVSAVSALGMNAQFRGDTVAARRFFSFAEKLSRRDLVTQLWAIEDAVSRGDIRGALRHYDVALRTKPALSDMLFPVLTAASAEPAVRAELVRTLSANPPWGDLFINHVAERGKDPRAVARLHQDLRRAGVNVPEGAQASAVATLLTTGDADEVWNHYSSLRQKVDRRRSRDARFAANFKRPSPLDWVAINDAGVNTAIEEGLFDFSAPASVGGPLLQQVQVLPAGDYLLKGHSSGIDQIPEARPYWILTCSDGRELGRLDMPNSDQAGGNFSGIMRVPANCAIQTLTMMARPSEAVGGSSGRLDRVELTPVAR